MSTAKRHFETLFRETCFHFLQQDFAGQLSEIEAKRLSNDIRDKTGLILGWKSLKNYSVSVNNSGKTENPSLASLDTLARYVLQAPSTDEIARKESGSPYEYWYKYLDRQSDLKPNEENPRKERKKSNRTNLFLILLALAGIASWWYYLPIKRPLRSYATDFNNLKVNQLVAEQWEVLNLDSTFFNQSSMAGENLILYTLKGDNYEAPDIRNVMSHPVKQSCFSTEIFLRDFVPVENWQQAGLILYQNQNDLRTSIRISMVYNNFFGGYQQEDQILIQILSLHAPNQTKPVLLKQHPLFNNVTNDVDLVRQNLRHSAIRIVYNDGLLKVYFANGMSNIFAYQEIFVGQVAFTPDYIGLFASSGNCVEEHIIPVRIAEFKLTEGICK